MKNLLTTLRRFTIYETQTMIFITGSDEDCTMFRLMRIRRLDPLKLSIEEDKNEYTEQQFSAMMEQEFNKDQESSFQTCIRKTEAAAIFGFVRFTEGYYIVVSQAPCIVAKIGCHSIYKVNSFDLISVYPKSMQSDSNREKKYIKMFHNADPSSNMFFSYTYDLTHSLQHYYRIVMSESGEGNRAFRFSPDWKFVWNETWLNVVRSLELTWAWFSFLIHGYIGTFAMEFAGHNLIIVLISRRSSKMAGTRYLKRGGDVLGNVANEVETEQIVHLGSCFLIKGQCSSFVILRGSVPGYWSQDSKQVPLPPITFDRPDPFHTCACQHFKQLLQRHGSPILVLNLVKHNEKKKREEYLSDHFQKAVSYAQQFIPVNTIFYTHYDMSSGQRSEPGVFGKLDEISKYYVKQTGFFANLSPRKTPVFQRGITRVNCVDCLDRTNTAMYSIAKHAIGYQLQKLGYLDESRIDDDSYFERRLRSLYEESGDTLALQYGGSQMVHNVNTYKKTSPWTSQSREIMHVLSRCYNNAFSDSDKQACINVFLGIFLAYEHSIDIWDLSSDQLLHEPRFSLDFKSPQFVRVTIGLLARHLSRSCTAWLGKDLWNALPNAIIDESILDSGPKDHPLRLHPFEESHKINLNTRFFNTFDFQLMNKHFIEEEKYMNSTSGLTHRKSSIERNKDDRKKSND
ncbi:hypothetical protein ACOME3_005619 [Neoechinorhynchus agilis]